MKISLPSFEKLDINQSTATLSAARFEASDHALLLVPKGKKARVDAGLPMAELINARLRRGGKAKTPGHIVLELGNRRATRLVVAFVDPEADAFTRLTTARKALSVVQQESSVELACGFAGLGDATSSWAEAVVQATGAAAFALAHFKSNPEAGPKLQRLRLLGLPKRIDFSQVLAGVQGNNLARWLSTLPGNALPPARYRKLVAELAREFGWAVETLDTKALTKKGCGAFLAVVQASDEQDAAILRIRYRPKSAKAKGHVALVGKGICYDTGGVNLKPARHMFGMHEDMMGSAVALGTLLALTELNAPLTVDCWLALAQNHIGPKSYKPNDVITACDGTTIEIVHTDAEGRMVLADTLALVARTKPGLVLDYATLTGTCVAALGTRYSGVFTNRPDFNARLMEIGAITGERVWPFPQDEDYDSMLDSKVADLKQCSMEGDADHILGARFLSRFIGKDTPWVHMDLSAGGHKGGLGAIPTENTGFGVQFTLAALLGDRALPVKR